MLAMDGGTRDPSLCSGNTGTMVLLLRVREILESKGPI